MPNKRIPMRRIEEVLRLNYQGHSNRDISRRTGISRPTVSEYLQKAQKKGITWPLPENMDNQTLENLLFPPAPVSQPAVVIPKWEDITLELQKHHHLTLQLLWIEYKEQNPNELSYSTFCARYKAWKKKSEVVMHFEHRAGEKFF